MESGRFLFEMNKNPPQMKNPPSDGPHSEGLPERGDKDLLQMRRNRTYSEGMSKPGLTGEKQVKIF